MMRIGKPVILFHGMKRSGNHAVINWILSDGGFAFHNNALPFDRFHGKGGHSYRAFAARFLWDELRTGGWKARARLVSVEDVAIAEPVFTGLPRSARHIILLRDPVNLFASRIRKSSSTARSAYATDPAGLQRSLDLWKEHAREFLGLTQHLPNRVGIHFDRWVSEPTYRSSLAGMLKIAPTDASLEKVASYGGGSSFGGSQREVLNRDTLLEPSERAILDRILGDPELRSLAERLAGTSA